MFLSVCGAKLIKKSEALFVSVSMKLTNAGTALGELATRHLACVLYGTALYGTEAVQEMVFKLIA